MSSEVWAEALRGAGACATMAPMSPESVLTAFEDGLPIIFDKILGGPPSTWFPPGLLDSNETIRFLRSPLKGSPLKVGGDSIMRPAEEEMPLDQALREMRGEYFAAIRSFLLPVCSRLRACACSAMIVRALFFCTHMSMLCRVRFEGDELLQGYVRTAPADGAAIQTGTDHHTQ